MDKAFLLGVDVGSSDCKVMLLDTVGRVIASAQQPYPTRYPHPGWAEQNPDDWYASACATIRQCIQRAQVAPKDVIALAVGGPAHNVALMDASGNILRPTIHWSDLRSTPQAQRLQAECGDRIFEITYSIVNPSWTLTQLLWLRENEPDTWARLRKFLVTKDYVRYRLTGIYQTDIYDAIGTQLYDVSHGSWSAELCALLGFDMSWLPDIAEAHTVSGRLTAEAAADTGLVAGMPVVVSSGDSVIEAFGIGAIAPGQCIVKLGTAANVNIVTAEARPSRQSITYRHVVAPHWFTITATNSGASTMRWFRDTFCRLEVEQAQRDGVNVYSLIDQLAAGAPPGANGLLFHPYLMGERTPHWDPQLRGDFIGISAQHRTNHFARAILEGVAFSLRECLEVVESLGQQVTSLALIGGGAKSPLWRQVICDVLGKPLQKPFVEDAAFGAAVFAGVGVGVFRDWAHAVSTCVQLEQVLYPNEEVHDRYRPLFQIYRDVTRDLAVHSHRLAQLAEEQ